MIRLIATDLDGTLLRDDKSLPEEFRGLAEELTRRGIVFVAASGRQYANVYNALYPMSEQFRILSDNGAVNGKGRTVTDTFLMPPDKVDAVLAGLDGIEGARPLVCTAACGYYADDDPDFVREMHRYYVRIENVAPGAPEPLKTLRTRTEKEDMIGKEASKVAVFCHGRANELNEQMPDVPGLVHFVSGADWIDFARRDVNKGRALAALLKTLGIDPADCLAFGDQFNDREMLELCGSRFVTANASAGMRALFPVIGSNNDGAVIAKIREFL